MSALLRIRAGREAYEHIQRHGLQPSDIGAVVAAAGGPKWFNVYGLTRSILGAFLRDTIHPIHFLGASVGSWQMTAALTDDPAAAIDRLRDAYANHIYDEKLDATEITAACRIFIQRLIDDQCSNIIEHPSRILHVVTSRGKGLLSSKSKTLLAPAFGFSYLSNVASRKALRLTAERTIFSTDTVLPFDTEVDELPTIQQRLTSDNLLPALQASGTIPFMMEQQYTIPLATPGAYWDGGMTDYHIALPYNIKGLVLHPHFYSFVYPGWFDKKIPWNRHASKATMSKVILLSPSEAFVDSLPLQRLAEMKDAQYFGKEQDKRVHYWNTIADRSLALGEEFLDLVSSGRLAEIVEAY